jgi:biopolymer transport protein ExbD
VRLPRNFKMFRGGLDASAVAGTMFLLWMVTLLHSSLVLPAGIRLRLPEAEGLWGEVVPQWSVAVDRVGRLSFEHQLIPESNLVVRLREQVRTRGTNQTLLLLADQSVSMATLARLANLARTAGVRDVVLATSPRPGATSPMRASEVRNR